MKKDSAEKKVYSIKQLNKIMGYVLLGTAFLISFLFIDKNIKNNWWHVVLGVLGGALLIEIIVWIILYFQFKKKNETENDKNIKKAIKELEKEASEDTQNIDEHKEDTSSLDNSNPIDPSSIESKSEEIQG